jgi:hypothetical protein
MRLLPSSTSEATALEWIADKGLFLPKTTNEVLLRNEAGEIYDARDWWDPDNDHGPPVITA